MSISRIALVIMSLICFISAFGLGIFVFARDSRKSVNRRFAIFALVLAFWGLGAALVSLSPSRYAAVHFITFHEMVLVNIPPTYFAFTSALISSSGVSRTRNKLVIAALLTGVGFTILATTSLFTASAIQYSWGYVPKPRIGHHIFTIYFFVVVFLAIYDLFVALEKSTSHLRNQIKYVIFASIIGFGLGSVSFLSLYGVPIFPLGPVGISLAMVILTYAIVRHHLMDIEAVIRKGVVYSILTALLAGTYFALVHFTEVQFERLAGWHSIWLPIVAIIALATVFEPMRRGTQSLVDRIFFKTKYEYRDAIRTFSQMVVTILDLDILLDRTVRAVKEILKIDRALLLLYEQGEKKYKVATFSGVDENIARTISFGPRSRFVQDLKRKGESVAIEVDSTGYSVVAISLFIKNDLIGFLILGEKLSGDIYTKEDLELLTTLANQLSIAIENARLYRAAVTDNLTKLFDETYFYQRLTEELTRSEQQRTPLSVIMIDIDHFSSFGKAKGRAVSNHALVEIGQAIRENIRPFDIAARVGEDEFALILPGVSSPEAVFVGAKLRKTIGAIKIEGMRVGLAVSTGFACAEKGDKEKESLLNEARLSLCHAKEVKKSKPPRRLSDTF